MLNMDFHLARLGAAAGLHSGASGIRIMNGVGRISQPVFFIAAGLAAAMLSDAATAQESRKEEAQKFVAGELIVGYATPQDREQAVRDMLTSGARLYARGLDLPAQQARAIGAQAALIQVRIPSPQRSGDAGSSAASLSALRAYAAKIRERDSTVKYAHPNWIIPLEPPLGRALPTPSAVAAAPAAPGAAAPNDPAYALGLHWHYQAPPMGMNAVGAWRLTTGSKDVVVAVIDTGMVFDHPDVQGSDNVLPGYNFVSPEKGGKGRSATAADPGDTCTEEGQKEPSWHGAHVAGTIGAAQSNNGRFITGVNWRVTILPVRAMGKCGGAVKDVADGVRWAAGLPVPDVPANPRPAHVINMSLAAAVACTPDNAGYLLDAIREARAAGVVIVAAAGNAAADIKDVFPAGCEGVISVTASDKRGRLAYYSNHGNVSIMAPGGNTGLAEMNAALKTPVPEGVWSIVKDGVAPLQGTSQAAPHVSGAIALAMAKYPHLRGKPDLVARLLRTSAAPLLPNACFYPCGAGQLDALRLIEAAGSEAAVSSDGTAARPQAPGVPAFTPFAGVRPGQTEPAQEKPAHKSPDFKGPTFMDPSFKGPAFQGAAPGQGR